MTRSLALPTTGNERANGGDGHGGRRSGNRGARGSRRGIGGKGVVRAGGARTGDNTSSYELAREYGFTDYDGRRPLPDDHFAKEVVTSLKWMREGVERHVAWLDRIAARGRRYLGIGPT